MLEPDDLDLHFDQYLDPCTQQSKSQVMPSGIATWQVSKKMAIERI
jgi:hypothetical protein